MKKLLLLLLLVTLMAPISVYATDGKTTPEAVTTEVTPYAEGGLPADLSEHTREYLITNGIVVEGVLTFTDTGLYRNADSITPEVQRSIDSQLEATFSADVAKGYANIYNKEANLLSDYIVLETWGEALATLTEYRQSGYSPEKYVILPTSATTAYLVDVTGSNIDRIGAYIDTTLNPLTENILKDYTLSVVAPKFTNNGAKVYTTELIETVTPYLDSVGVYNIGSEYGLKLNSRYTFILTSALQQNGVYTKLNDNFEYMYRVIPYYVLKSDITKDTITTSNLQLVEQAGKAIGYDILTDEEVTYTEGDMLFEVTGTKLDYLAVVPYQAGKTAVYIQAIYREMMGYGSSTLFTFEAQLDLRPVILGETTEVKVTQGGPVEFDTYVSEENTIKIEGTSADGFDLYIVNKKLSTERFVNHILTDGKKNLSQSEIDKILADLQKRYKSQNRDSEWAALMAKHDIKVKGSNGVLTSLIVLLVIGVAVTGVLLLRKKKKPTKAGKDGVLINITDDDE